MNEFLAFAGNVPFFRTKADSIDDVVPENSYEVVPVLEEQRSHFEEFYKMKFGCKWTHDGAEIYFMKDVVIAKVVLGRITDSR